MNIQISITALLLGVAKADEKIEKHELQIITDVLTDFFDLSQNQINSIIDEAMDELKKSTDLYQFCKLINEQFNYEDKIKFILSIFQVAFIDNKLHYLEEHVIKQISNLLHVDHVDLINAKLEIKKYLN